MAKPLEKIPLQPRFKNEYMAVIQSFVKQKYEEAKASGVLVGLSGGLDSAVVTKICSDALGAKKILALVMPETATPKEDIRDALELASTLGVDYRVIDITDTVAAFSNLLSPLELNKNVLGNIKARCRMIILYIHANVENRIVMGTSNKSELLCGYFTKFGDGGVDFAPIGDLYKTQVIELAGTIGIPVNIIKKPPSAGLAPNQTDEKDLGIPYKDLDRILLGIELRYELKYIAEKIPIDASEVERIHGLVERSVHKRKMPLIPKLGIRTLGLDWRE